MSPATSALLAAGLGLALALPASGGEDKWIGRDVEAIASDVERDVYRALDDDRARARFRDRFWLARDPTSGASGTAASPVRLAHERRFEEASRQFGPASGAGRGADRGNARHRLHVALGPPAERIVFERRELWPIELWSYERLEIPGLPAFFQVLFVGDGEAKDFRIYDPGSDGPERLLRPDRGGRVGRQAALRALHLVSAALDAASLSLLPREPADAPLDPDEPVASSRLVAHLRDLRNRLPVDLGYLLEPEYRSLLLPLSLYHHGAFGLGGASVLHYGVEVPAGRLQFEPRDGRVVAALAVSGGVFAGDGQQAVRAIEDRVDVVLDPERHEQLAALPFAFEDVADLVPGTYRITLVVRDLTSGEVGVVSDCVDVPLRRYAGLTAGPILLAASAVPSSDVTRPFFFAGRAWHPAPGAVFDADGSIQAVFEVARAAARPRGKPLSVRYRILSGNEEELTGFDQVETDSLGVGTGLIVADLSEISPGDHVLKVELSDDEGGRASRSAAFSVRPAVPMSHPWILLRRREPAPAERSLELARQYLVRGDGSTAYRTFEWLRGDSTTNASTPEVRAQASLTVAAWMLERKDFAAAAAAAGGLDGIPGLLYLARAQAGLGLHREALATFGRALALLPKDRRILDAMVEELAIGRGGRGSRDERGPR